MTLTRLFRLTATHPSVGLLAAAGKWFVVPDANHPWGSTILGEGDTPTAAIDAAWEHEHPTPNPPTTPPAA